MEGVSPDPEQWPDEMWLAEGISSREKTTRLPEGCAVLGDDVRNGFMQEEEARIYGRVVDMVTIEFPLALHSVFAKLSKLCATRLVDFVVSNDTDPTLHDGQLCPRALSHLRIAVNAQCITTTLRRHIHLFNQLVAYLIPRFHHLVSSSPSSPRLPHLNASLLRSCHAFHLILARCEAFCQSQMERLLFDMLERNMRVSGLHARQQQA